MKELLLQLARYNLWANQLLFSTINYLTEEEQKKEVISSFPGIYRTLLHMLDAESIWWQRIRLLEKINRPSDTFSGTTDELINELLKQDKLWLEYVEQAQEHIFNHEFIYNTSKKENFKQPTFQMLLHLFNHNTYHRGQLVTILRQLGVESIPATDFIVWSRKK